MTQKLSQIAKVEHAHLEALQIVTMFLRDFIKTLEKRMPIKPQKLLISVKEMRVE
jgi:hypothetical protein